eukprot:gene4236-8428_t
MGNFIAVRLYRINLTPKNSVSSPFFTSTVGFCNFTKICVFASPAFANGLTTSDAVSMKIRNVAGSPIEIFWESEEGSLVSMLDKPLRNSSETVINSYYGHEFVVKFYKGLENVEAHFIKGNTDEELVVSHADSGDLIVSKYDKGAKSRSSIKDATKACSHLRGQSFENCVAEGVYESVTTLTDSKEELIKYRDRMSDRLRNYTCADPKMESSLPIATRKISIQNKEYIMNTHFNTSHAKILSADNFITDEECAILEKYGSTRLRRATVAAEDGSSTISIHRKAQQAGYEINNNPADPLWGLYTRILEFTNAYTNYGLTPDGQEGFTIIQYNVGDEYTPHCDGACDGEAHNRGGRVATAVTYCQAAESGGATSFSKADVFVKPKRGRAAFFNYMGADGKMDEGYSQHSACPILSGEKWISVFWMRVGVTGDRPWTVYDPSGIPILDVEENNNNSSSQDNEVGEEAWEVEVEDDETATCSIDE